MLDLTIDGRCFRLSSLAHKRGLQILHAQTDHLTLIDRGRLRRLQRKLAGLIHEHVLIFSSESPRKQVWIWAIRTHDGRRLRHREHPFFSESPPPCLLQRLERLRFTLDEEEGVTLSDALKRVREVLDTRADLNLFVNRPQYARRSDELAAAMQAGGAAELHEFLLFHRALVTWAVRSLRYLYGNDLEDAEQTGMIGLIHAARHWQRERGVQFSTYAVRCIQGICRRHASAWYLPVRFPEHVIWACLKAQAKVNLASASGGNAAVASCLEELARADPQFPAVWRRFSDVRDMRSLSDRRQLEYRQARNLVENRPPLIDRLLDEERIAAVRQAVEQLSPRSSDIVRSKYGFDGQKQTLEQIAGRYGITRERVRQCLVKAYERLRAPLCEWIDSAKKGEAEEDHESRETADTDERTEL